MPLSPKQRLLCDEFLKCRKKIEAYQKAGYKMNRTATSNACRVYDHPAVQAYLLPRLEKVSEKAMLTAERVLEELGRLAMANITDYYKVDAKGKIVPKELHELTREQTAAIAEVTEKGLKLYDKTSALDKLAKHFKLYTDLEAGVTNFVIMPTLKKNGVEVVFNVGRPAPEPPNVK